MAGGSKKRRGSRSPDRTVSSKRARHHSIASVHSQSVGCDPHLSRAQSVFRGDQDPYFPSNHQRATSSPTGDDWVFRVKVISSSTDLNDDVFKKAVQGLVKICFPQGVLDELGIQVLEAHMREEHAPQANIDRMTKIFRSEMIHRLTWMLAEYLDTSERIEATLHSTIAASARLHGVKIGDDVLGEVTASLSRLRELFPNDSTRLLANGSSDTFVRTGASIIVEGSGNDEMLTDDASESSEEEPAPPPKKKNKKRDTSKKRNNSRIRNNAIEHADLDIDPPSAQPEQSVKKVARPPRTDQENKISSTWRWDINDAYLAPDAVSKSFKRPSDLFAYHALPIAKTKLGGKAKRKDIRHAIQSMIAHMPNDEYDKWVESFDKLLDGDNEMLVRSSTSNSQGTREATAAPVEARRRGMETGRGTPSTSDHPMRALESVSIPPQTGAHIKRELRAHSSAVPNVTQRAPQEDGVTGATTALRHLSTEDRDIGPPVNSVEASSEQRLEGRKPAPIEKPAQSKADLVNLLWPGAWSLDNGDRGHAVKMIMDGLEKRSIDVTRFDGTTVKQTKVGLRSLLHTIRAPEVKEVIDRKLIPWMLASPASFPELLNEPIFFAHLMPYINPVLNLLCGSWVHFDKDNTTTTKNTILTSLLARGIPMSMISGASRKSVKDRVEQILGWKCDKITIRGILEQELRYLTFEHKSKFPELKASALVKFWERETGQQW